MVILQAHITSILRSKFTNFRNFDTSLYTCAPEFDFVDPEVGVKIIIIIIILCLLWGLFCKSLISEIDILNKDIIIVIIIIIIIIIISCKIDDDICYYFFHFWSFAWVFETVHAFNL